MKRRVLDVLLLAGLIVAASLFICHEALRKFDFYDMSAFLDAGYRVWRGQKIYVDFYYIAGPVHPYLHALFFSIFGFNKTAVLVHLCVTQAVTLSTVYVISRRYLHPFWASAIVILVSLSMYGTVGHPWYDQNAMMFYMVGAAAFLFSHPFKGVVHTLVLPAIAGGCMALSFLTKTNVGASGGGILLLGYAWSGWREGNVRPVVVYALAGAAVAALLVFTTASPLAYYQQNFFAFDTNQRMLDTDKLDRLMAAQPLWPLGIAGALIVGLGGLRWADENRALVSLFFATWICGVFSGWTSSTLPRAYAFFLGLIILFLCLMVASLPEAQVGTSEHRVKKTGKITAWIAIPILMIFSWNRLLAVWTWQYIDNDSSYTMQNSAFAGWHCAKEIGPGMDAAVKYIEANVPANDSILIMPDCQIIYGITGRDSYRQVPWSLNVQNSPGPHGSLRQPMIEHFLKDPPKWLLLRDEGRVWAIVTKQYLKGLYLWDTINRDYEPVWRCDEFVMCRYGPSGAAATRPADVFAQ